MLQFIVLRSCFPVLKKTFFEIHSKNLRTSNLLTTLANSFINSKKKKFIWGEANWRAYRRSSMRKMSKKIANFSAQEKICKLVRLAILLTVRQHESNWLLKQRVVWLYKNSIQNNWRQCLQAVNIALYLWSVDRKTYCQNVVMENKRRWIRWIDHPLPKVA